MKACRTGCAASAGALALVLFIGGCASSAPTRMHALLAVPPGADRGLHPATLSGAPAPAAIAYRGPPLRVASVQVPAAYDRQELVRQTAPGQYEVSEFDQWAAPLPRLARQTLADDLALRLPAAMLALPGTAAAEVRVDIHAFETAAGVATMRLSWSVRWPDSVGAGASPVAPAAAAASVPAGAATRQPISGETLQLQAPLPAGAAAASTAQAFSALLAGVADRIAAAVGAGR